jgi:hypothetical protein
MPTIRPIAKGFRRAVPLEMTDVGHVTRTRRERWLQTRRFTLAAFIALSLCSSRS